MYPYVQRGEIYYVQADIEKTIGHEQGGSRPAIIISNNIGNLHSGIVEIVYLTTQPKRRLPTHVDIHTTMKHSVALCEQISTVSKLRLIRYIGQCTPTEMENIDNALMISLALGGYNDV